MRKFFYSGDVNLQHGGTFYSVDTFDKWGYVDALRVTPCSDADGPDNLFWFEQLSVNVERSADDIESALNCIGQTPESLKAMKPAQRRHVVIDACIAYGFYDVTNSETVKVGGPKTEHLEYRGQAYNVHTTLRGNASLMRYARSIVREM